MSCQHSLFQRNKPRGILVIDCKHYVFISFTHSIYASGIQFVYDENENIPSWLGTTCVGGMLMCLENTSCTSLNNWILNEYSTTM